jgi:hypothetical protein
MHMTLPKPQFPYIGRLYSAAVEAGLSPSTLNRESVDGLIRILQRTNWAQDNVDIIQIWNRGGDAYGDMIKAVRAYSATVNQVTRVAKAAIRAQEKADAQAAKKAAKNNT